jgi:hypothetical protein
MRTREQIVAEAEAAALAEKARGSIDDERNFIIGWLSGALVRAEREQARLKEIIRRDAAWRNAEERDRDTESRLDNIERARDIRAAQGR